MSFSKWLWSSKDRDRNGDRNGDRDRDRDSRRKSDPHDPRAFIKAPVDVLMKLDANTLNKLPSEVLERLPTEGLRRLSPETLGRLSSKVLAKLPTEWLITLPPSAIVRLGCDAPNHLPIEVVLRLPPEHLAALPPRLIEQLSPEVLARLDSLPGSVLNALSESTLHHLRPSILANLSPERLPSLPVDILANVPFITFMKLPAETLSRLPTSTLITLPPQALANLDPDALSRLPPHVRQRIPAAPTQSVSLQPSSTQSQTELPSAPRTVQAESETGHQYRVLRGQGEQMGAAKTTMTKQIGRSKSVSLLSGSISARQDDQKPRTNADGLGPADLRTAGPPQNDNIGRDPQKRASYRHLRHQTNKNSASGTIGEDQSSDIRIVSPLGAVIAEAHKLQRDSEGRQGRSNSLRRSLPQPKATQNSLKPPPDASTLTDETRLGGPPDPAERQPTTLDLAPGEKRVPSSGSQTSIASRRSLRQSQTGGQHKQTRAKETQDMTHCSVQPDQRAAAAERSPGTRHETPRHEVPRDAEIQLQTSLNVRDRLIVELQAALDDETARATKLKTSFEEATLLFEQQKNKYEGQLTDLREKLAWEQAKQEENVRLLKSKWDEKLQEERQKLHRELAKGEATFHAFRRHHVAEHERQKHDYLDQIATLERAISERDEKHAESLENLRQEHRTQMDALTDKLKTQRVAHDQQVEILTGQLQDQDGDYRKQIAQLNGRHAHEIQNLRGAHQIETAAINDKSNVYAESLRRQFEDQLRLQHDHYQREIQLLKDRHHNALQQQALEHSRMVDSLRAESGDFVRKASDDKLNARFGQLKIAVEIITEPFNLGRIVIQSGSTLDPTGFLQRERGMQRHLLRSLIWAKIAHGFFSAPFGFGAFGEGSGRQMLLELLLQWRRLLAPELDNSAERSKKSPDILPDIHVLCQDRETNRWRSATFQSIMAIVTARTSGSSGSETGKPDLRSTYAENRSKVQREILDVLNEATNNRVAREIEEKVDEITGLAGELALEMGVHRAYLGLEFPNRGDQVVIGRDFIDCEDGDPAGGMLEEVDLVVCPRFFKIGDGRGDMTASKSIFRGEVYPKRA